jgi:predicted N-acyltransferase
MPPDLLPMKIEIVERLDQIAPAGWNRLGGTDNPFLRHEFLAGLERFHCVGDEWGWLPRHLIARDGDRLLGAVPLYLKYNSYGEFVFDFSWADAYRRAGRSYYPKLVAGVPYSPVTGPRLLLAADSPAGTGDALIEFALQVAAEWQVSSLHWLFPPKPEAVQLEQKGLVRRSGIQFHWFNQGYRDFDDFLAGFTAEKRKKVKRERRRVVESGVEIELLDGTQVSEAKWEEFHRLYTSTFDKLGGYATLTVDFFKHLGRTLPQAVVLVLARHRGRTVAAAFNLRSGDTLYGRHWGCCEEFHSLHFEACYHTGIDYCIREGLTRFEPGAQGEHKVSRGFVPVTTWSNHWLSDPLFRRAVGNYLHHEAIAVEEYRRELAAHAPYKARG